MWIIRDNYGDDPAPRRYFLREAPEEKTEKEPDWRSFTVILMRALMPFEEAKAAVLAAFREAGAVPASP